MTTDDGSIVPFVNHLERERERLREYRAALAATESELAKLTKEAEGLRQIVSGFERIVGPELADHGATERHAQPTPHVPTGRIQTLTPPPRKRLGLAAFLRKLMADGQRRHLDDILKVLSVTEPFASNMPGRNSVSNRLFDLDKKGYLHRVARGTYQLASSNGSAQSVDAEGTTEADPIRATQLGAGEGLGSTPPGGFS